MPPAAPATDPLPTPLLRALEEIAAELNDMPRECVRDHGALCQWKGRIARRVRALKNMRVTPTILRVMVPVEVRVPRKRKVRGRPRQQMEMRV